MSDQSERESALNALLSVTRQTLDAMSKKCKDRCTRLLLESEVMHIDRGLNEIYSAPSIDSMTINDGSGKEQK